MRVYRSITLEIIEIKKTLVMLLLNVNHLFQVQNSNHMKYIQNLVMTQHSNNQREIWIF